MWSGTLRHGMPRTSEKYEKQKGQTLNPKALAALGTSVLFIYTTYSMVLESPLTRNINPAPHQELDLNYSLTNASTISLKVQGPKYSGFRSQIPFRQQYTWALKPYIRVLGPFGSWMTSIIHRTHRLICLATQTRKPTFGTPSIRSCY